MVRGANAQAWYEPGGQILIREWEWRYRKNQPSPAGRSDAFTLTGPRRDLAKGGNRADNLF
jgi:hypothetical protein